MPDTAINAHKKSPVNPMTLHKGQQRSESPLAFLFKSTHYAGK